MTLSNLITLLYAWLHYNTFEVQACSQPSASEVSREVHKCSGVSLCSESFKPNTVLISLLIVTKSYKVQKPHKRAKPRSHRATRPIKLMLKIGSIHTDSVDARRASTNLHTSNERYVSLGYWTSNNNKWPKCSCRYQTPPDNTCANDVIDNDVTENDVIDSWMNMHTLLASRPKCGRVDARRASTNQNVTRSV